MLTVAQQGRLQSLHAYEWLDEEVLVTNKNLDAIFLQIETPEELWYASFIVPWDLADGSLRRILDHRLCDRGIALFVYWSLDPISFHRRGGEIGHPIGTLIKQIEQRFAEGYYLSEQIAYSPLKSGNYRDRHDGVPASMLNSTSGLSVELDYRNAVFSVR